MPPRNSKEFVNPIVNPWTLSQRAIVNPPSTEIGMVSINLHYKKKNIYIYIYVTLKSGKKTTFVLNKFNK